MTRSFTFLVNPDSGDGAAPQAVLPVARLLRGAGARVVVASSSGPQAVAALVARAVERGDVVVAVGGDGTLSHLVGAVCAGGGVVGVLPAGRGNDFARMLGLPTEPEEVAELLLHGAERRVDLLSWQAPGAPERLVAGSVYSGVDARAAALVDRMRWTPKPLQYPLGAVRALATYQPGRFRVVVDGVVAEYAAATVVVANSGYYGQGMHIAPSARVDDGLLDVVVVEAASRLELIRRFPRIYGGSHVELPEVTVLTGRRVEIAADARASVPVGADGEALGSLPGLGGPAAVVELRPGALRVVG